MIPVVIIIVVVFAVGVLFLTKSSLGTPIGILDGIYYDMSPAELKEILCDPQNVTDNRNLSGETIYYYTVDIDGILTETSFSFQEDQTLASVFVFASAETSVGSKEIFENWESKLYDAYKDEKGFFCDEIFKTSDTDYEIRLGTHNGATGVHCSVSADENVVRLTCINLR